MRFWCALVATVSMLSFVELVPASPTAAQPVHTNRTRFRIPFKYDPTEMQKLGAREIRLYLSTDQGLSWRLAQTLDPRERKFDFIAPGDGEYWFAVRTLDALGQLHPAGIGMEPGLKVVVDMTPPAFEIGLRQLEPGKVELTWTAADPHLDPTTLRLEYVQAGAPNWQTVSVIPQASGRTAWSAPEGGFVAVRGSISDLAGNAQSAQSQTNIAAAGQTGPRSPDFREPIAAERPSGPASRTPLPYPGRRRDLAAFSAVADAATARPDILQGRYPRRNEPEPFPSDRRRIVNSRRFQIGYQVADVGPSGIGSVELYISEDNGRKWYKYGDDPDAKSPFPVEVPIDGTYGFALRVRSGAGLSADPPLPGEEPSIVVVVDETPPELELLPVQQGNQPDRLIVRWRMSDANPADRPIALYYAADRSGPWQPVAEGLDNSRSFTWVPGPDMPTRLYLRLTARDAAGNTATVEAPDPVTIDLSRPTARIVDVIQQ